MKGNKSTALTLAQKCKNILASNWHGNLNTIKADSQGSKQDIYSSKVKYLLRKGKPYIWVPEKDLHNVNTIIDERASFAVARPYPGPLANVLRSMKKLPVRIALSGEIIPLGDEKVRSATESLRKMVMSEQKEIIESSYAVSGILSSSTFGNTSRSENLVDLLDDNENYAVYKFNASSCTFIDGNNGSHEVNPDEFGTTKPDRLSPFAAKLIDGINQSEIRRRALVVLCFALLNENAKDAYMLSVDHKGFDMLAKVLSGGAEYQWKEFRITFEEEAEDVELFCTKLVQMEEAALDKVKSCSGLG
ncbi:hypothetical protein SOVF_081420 [Spinacia oleracea]|uniref:DUF2470 domain-containing protein n=1 Tax=Spinacia oleracea TaxID=3562 RepID=A0A9R0J3P4_SPIOL|nr:uncharacterized protein LOC110798484 [Spinacia oleracea]KNA17281.1 hypothetical protein SOVF_081420 [Spinacia oleracea]